MASGDPELTSHSLRITKLTNLFRKFSGDIEKVKRFAKHSNEKITKKYIRPVEDNLVDFVD